MAKENQQSALAFLLDLSATQGYVTFDDIMDSADKWSLPISAVDWLSNEITMRGILVYDEVPSAMKNDTSDEYDDYAQTDYEAIFKKSVELSPSMAPIVESIRYIRPPQFKEISQLKYQVIEGNEHARQRMIEMHLRLALKIALNRALQYDMELVDMFGLACIGLITAVDRYNPDSNGAFSSYASLWVVQNISREQATQNPDIYFPVHKREEYYTIYPLIKERQCDQCSTNYRCQQLLSFVQGKLGCTLAQAEDTLLACCPPTSLEMFLENIVVSEKHDVFLEAEKISYEMDVEMIADIDLHDLSERVDKALRSLKSREREVLIERFGLNGGREKTLEEVGEIFGVTRERIRQIENKALRRLQHPSRSRQLHDYH